MRESPPSSTEKPAAILFSGGLDSSILLKRVLQQHSQVYPLYIRSGLVWEEAEFAAADRFHRSLSHPGLAPITKLEMPVSDLYGEHWSLTGEGTPGFSSDDSSVCLPGRNTMLVTKAAIWCHLQGINRLYLAPLGSSPFPDASNLFLHQLNRLVNRGMGATKRKLEIVCPFAGLTKGEVMSAGQNLSLQWTFSCISPVASLHCGRCNKCSERQLAFRNTRVTDPTPYAEVNTALAIS